MFKFKKQLELSPRLKSGVGRGYSKNQVFKIIAFVFLILAAGLAINSFRIIFFGGKGNNIANQSSSPEVLGASDSKDQPTTADVQFIEYKVKKGDTLFNISQEAKVSWMTLATLNNLKSPFSIKPGQVIKIPK